MESFKLSISSSTSKFHDVLKLELESCWTRTSLAFRSNLGCKNVVCPQSSWSLSGTLNFSLAASASFLWSIENTLYGEHGDNG